MKSLKQVYSSIFKKYQLKEAYNNLFELRDANIIDTNNIQNKIEKASGFLNEEHEVLVPGLGKFRISKMKTLLIGLVIEYYYGNKEIAKYIATTSLVNLGLIKENEENVTKPELILSFLNYLKQKGIEILDDDFNLTDKINKKALSGNDYFIQKNFGFLFEIYALKKIKREGYKTNYNEFLNNAIGYIGCKYIFAILDILYLYDYKEYTVENMSILFDESLTEERINELEKYIVFDDINLVENLIDEKIKGNKHYFFFKFLYEDAFSERAIDIEVSYKNKIVSLLDLKTHESVPETDEEENVTKRSFNKYTSISKSKHAVKNQVAKIINKEYHTDFTIGLLRTTHEFKKNEIKIIKADCLYTSYKDKNDYVMNKDTRSYRINEVGIIADSDEKRYAISDQTKSFRFDFYNQNLNNVISNSKSDIEKNILKMKWSPLKLKSTIEHNEDYDSFNRYDFYFKKNKIKEEDLEKVKNEVRNFVFLEVKNQIINSKKEEKINYNQIVKSFEKVDDADYDQHICYTTEEETKDLIENKKKTIIHYFLNYDQKLNYCIENLKNYFRGSFVKEAEEAIEEVRNLVFSEVKNKITSGEEEIILTKHRRIRQFEAFNNSLVNSFEKVEGKKHSQHKISDQTINNKYIEIAMCFIKNEIIIEEEQKKSHSLNSSEILMKKNTIKRRISRNSTKGRKSFYLEFNDEVKKEVRKQTFKLKSEVNVDNLFYNFVVSSFEEADDSDYSSDYIHINKEELKKLIKIAKEKLESKINLSTTQSKTRKKKIIKNAIQKELKHKENSCYEWYFKKNYVNPFVEEENVHSDLDNAKEQVRNYLFNDIKIKTLASTSKNSIELYNHAVDCFTEFDKKNDPSVDYSEHKIDESSNESSMRLEDLILEVYSYIYNKQK